MSSRKKIWDVDDAPRLRRASLASDNFNDDNYYEQFLGPFEHYTNGGDSTLNLTFSARTLATAVDRWVRAQIYWPQHWRKGRLEITSYWRHDNGVNGALVDIENSMQAIEVSDAFTILTPINAVETSVTLNDSGVHTQMFAVTETSGVVERADNVILAWRCQRNGSTGATDDAAVTIYFMGVRLRWKPELLS